MLCRSLALVADHAVLSDLRAAASQSNEATARLLQLIAEIDERRLYLPEGYPSMYLFCVHDLHMSEGGAYKRIQAARAARRFPAILTGVACGKLHLTAVVLLAPHLTTDNATNLLAAATHRSKAQIEQLLAQRCPRPETPTSIRPVATSAAPTQLVPEPVDASQPEHAPVHVEPARPRLAPLSPGHFELRCTLSQAAHDKLRYAESLLGHILRPGDIPALIERALDQLIVAQERRVFAATAKPRPQAQRGPAKGRHIPAEVRRAVWQRDHGRCTFVSDSGTQCHARTRLQFDHIEPVARGGESTPANLRLRCRAHNQFAAERAFGAGFMQRKREEARVRQARKRENVSTWSQQLVPEPVVSTVPEQLPAPRDSRADQAEVVPYLRALGLRTDEAQRGAAMCDALPNASLEACVRAPSQSPTLAP